MKHLFYFFVISILISCGSGKYATSYKLEKKSTDSLIILRPLILIEMVKVNKKEKNLQLTESNSVLITKTTHEVLESKYTLIGQEIENCDTNLIFNLCDNLENSEKNLSGHYLPILSSKREINEGPKYALLIVYKGLFNPNFEPHYNMNAGITTNTLIINPSTKPYSDLSLLIINRDNNEVVFYSSDKTTNSDPRVQEEIEEMTKMILKPIYYK